MQIPNFTPPPDRTEKEKSTPTPRNPSESPKSSRDFDKIFEKEKEKKPMGRDGKPPIGKDGKPIKNLPEAALPEEGENELPEKTEKDLSEKPVKSPEVSKEKNLPKEEMKFDHNITRGSPSELFQKLAKEKPIKKMEPPKKSISPSSETVPKGEIASAQSSTPPSSIQAAEVKSDSQPQTDTASRATQVQELIDVMVENIEIMTSEGKVDTTITLQHPPLFNGSTVTISSQPSAPGNFQVSFHNLDPAAKTLLDMQSSQDSLRLALEQKGYSMQITTISTEPERPILSQESKPSDQRGQQERQGEQGGGGQQEGRERRQR